jgi:DNA-binding XRE family transcriptional regulator
LRAWRQSAGLTQEQFARLAGVTLATINGLENARGQPEIETAAKLAAALGIYIEQIIWLATTNRPPSKRNRTRPPVTKPSSQASTSAALQVSPTAHYVAYDRPISSSYLADAMREMLTDLDDQRK